MPWSPGAPECAGTLPRSCDELFQWGVRAGAPYRIDPDGSGAGAPFVSLCEMQVGVGGWTLVAKVNTADVDGVAEARTWFRFEARSDALATRGFVKNQPPSSHGLARLLPLARAGALARFDLYAELDTSQTARWYKVVASPASFGAWFSNDATPSRVCTDVALTQNCTNGIIAGRSGIYDATMLGGMNLADYGYSMVIGLTPKAPTGWGGASSRRRAPGTWVPSRWPRFPGRC
jgi:hypothetical protein